MSKILIIEDEEAIRRVLSKILCEENESYEVDVAEDGVIGLEKIKENDYDLVLCDIKMPKMDGVELLEAVKKIDTEIPIVMISGHGDMETRKCYTKRITECFIAARSGNAFCRKNT